MSDGVSTKKTGAERKAILEAWWNRIWKDGSYVHWVNEKYQCLDCPKLAKHLFDSDDESMFKRNYGKKYRDDFNKKLAKIKAGGNGGIVQCDTDGQFEMSFGGDAPDKFLENFLATFPSLDEGPLGEVDRDDLRKLLNSYQNLSCQRYIIHIDKLQNENKSLQGQNKKKDKKLVEMREEIALFNTRLEEEEDHPKRSVRNLYTYDSANGMPIKVKCECGQEIEVCADDTSIENSLEQ